MKNHESNTVIKVAIADDHDLFRSGVKSSLSSRKDIQMVAEAENGMQLLKLLRHIQPDVVLLDLQMPIMDGLATLPEIKKLYPGVKVIILSMHNDHSVISRMMEIGANSYLTKESGSEMIYDAIRTVFEQDFFFNELTNKALLSGLRTKRTTESSMAQDVQLTDKEISILKLMADEKGTKEIADIVDLSPRTVEAIRDKLKTKTGTKSMAGLVMYAVKAGLIELDGPSYEVDQISSLSREQIGKLFSLSTAILAYINHDLAGQRNLIYQTVEKVMNALHIERTVDKQYNKIRKQIKNVLDAAITISSINNIIKSHFYISNRDTTTDFNKIFISKPKDIIDHISDRFKNISIRIGGRTLNSLEIVFPPQILLSILSELIWNSKKNSKRNLQVLLKWGTIGKVFFCEVHDNGYGFTNLKSNEDLVDFAHLKDNGNFPGIGLGMIHRTIFESNGQLFLSSSKTLGGALVRFEFPIIGYKYRASANVGQEILPLSKNQMANLFRLSTSILAYVNHDLSIQQKIIANSLANIIDEVIHLDRAQSGPVKIEEIKNNLEKASEAAKTIESITSLISSQIEINNEAKSTDLKRFLISEPMEILKLVRKRFVKAKIKVSQSSLKELNFIYPSQILLSILSELIENARRNNPDDLNVLIKWQIKGSLFQFEVHDNGTGFSKVDEGDHIPFTSLDRKVKGKTSGLGLGIIYKTILDSGGQLFFSRSAILHGALIEIDIPVTGIEFKTLTNE
jgi:DNA-binding NarL/FixJ family response regulator